jgi:hypothetical protein
MSDSRFQIPDFKIPFPSLGSAACSPSEKSATGLAGNTSGNLGAADGCSLSQRERVRVRENGSVAPCSHRFFETALAQVIRLLVARFPARVRISRMNTNSDVPSGTTGNSPRFQPWVADVIIAKPRRGERKCRVKRMTPFVLGRIQLHRLSDLPR